MHTVLRATYLGMARLHSGDREIAGSTNPNTLFVHGGVDLEWLRDRSLPGSVLDINRYTRGSVLTKRAMADFVKGESILWTRILATNSEDDVCGALIDEILAHFKVARIIVGHTPQEDYLAKTRCGGKIILTDVMMSRWMTNASHPEDDMTGGRPVAVIMKMNDDGGLQSIVAHYTDLATGTVDTFTDLLIAGNETSTDEH